MTPHSHGTFHFVETRLFHFRMQPEAGIFPKLSMAALESRLPPGQARGRARDLCRSHVADQLRSHWVEPSGNRTCVVQRGSSDSGNRACVEQRGGPTWGSAGILIPCVSGNLGQNGRRPKREPQQFRQEMTKAGRRLYAIDIFDGIVKVSPARRNDNKLRRNQVEPFARCATRMLCLQLGHGDPVHASTPRHSPCVGVADSLDVRRYRRSRMFAGEVPPSSGLRCVQHDRGAQCRSTMVREFPEYRDGPAQSILRSVQSGSIADAAGRPDLAPVHAARGWKKRLEALV